MQRQGSFAETEYAGKKKQTRRDKFLAEMEQVVPWARIFAILQNGGKDDRVKALSSEMRREVMRVSHDMTHGPDTISKLMQSSPTRTSFEPILSTCPSTTPFRAAAASIVSCLVVHPLSYL
jgi:hypothetical protein